MRILLISKTFPPLLGGEGMFVYVLARALSSKGHDVVVISGGGNKTNNLNKEKFEIIHSQHLLKLSKLRGGLIDVLFECKNIINGEKFDVIHCHSFGTLPIGEFFSNKHKAKLFFTPHETADYPRVFLNLISDVDLELSLAKQLIPQNLNKVIYVSEYFKKQFNSLFSKKTPNKVIYPGIKGTSLIFDKPKTLKKKKLIIGLLSRLTPRKDLVTPLFAIKHLIKKNPTSKFEFHIAKSVEPQISDFYLTLKTIIKNLEIEEYVRFCNIGSTEDEKWKFLNSIDILVMPSLIEGLGITVIEAFSMGKAVIASETTGLKELITNNVDGLYFETENSRELSDKILKLLNEPETLLKIGNNAKSKYLQKFELDIMTNNILQEYKI